MKKLWSIFPRAKKQIPHWGEYFTAEDISYLLDNEEFSVYRTKQGKSVNSVLISDSRKWLCISDRYYPLDLIAYFFDSLDVIVFIDGRRIKVHYGEDGIRARQCLKELFGPYAYREGKHTFFYADKNHRTGEPPVWIYDNECVKAFETLGFESPYNDKYHTILFNLEYDYNQEKGYSDWKVVYEKYLQDIQRLVKADWRQLRYEWEAAMLEVEFKAYDPSRQLRRELSNLGKGDNVLKVLNSMVLDDDTLKDVLAAIKNKEISDISGIFDISAYKDPFYVCNCIRLLEMMEQPANMVGIDFLFDCLNDIKEPYYDMAVELLVTFHDDLLIAVLESHFKKAIDDKDVLKMAGLMAFAERIHYALVG